MWLTTLATSASSACWRCGKALVTGRGGGAQSWGWTEADEGADEEFVEVSEAVEEGSNASGTLRMSLPSSSRGKA